MEPKQYKITTIDANTERLFMRRWHYSKKTVPNSAIRFGCYYGFSLIGVASFGRIVNCKALFKNASNREGLELNRLAMVDEAPKNSESRFLMVCIKLLKKQYPWLRFVSTWADGMRCNGGTIYKACGFLYLRKIPISNLYQLPDGTVIHQIAFRVYAQKYREKIKAIKGRVEKVQAIFGPSVKELRGGVPVPLYLFTRSQFVAIFNHATNTLRA